MRGRPKVYSIELSSSDKESINKILSDANSSKKLKQRALILELANLNTDIKEIIKKTESSKSLCYRVIRKYLSLGLDGALHDLKRIGRPAIFSEDAKIYIRQIACQKPYNLDKNLRESMWSLDSLVNYIHQNCKKAGFPELSTIVKTSIFNILNKTELKLNLDKINQNKRNYKANLFLYKRIEFLLSLKQDYNNGKSYVSIAYDDKPQTSTDNFNCKFIMSNTILSLMLGVDLVTGMVYHKVCLAHSCDDFFSFLDLLESKSTDKSKVNIILDNNRIHAMHETVEYLKTKKIKFNLIFNPKHSYFINLFETFLSKFIRVGLNGITADSKERLVEKIDDFFKNFNSCPFVYRFDNSIDDFKDYLE